MTTPTMVPKALFSYAYKGLHEVVTEMVGRYTNLADSCDYMSDGYMSRHI